MILLFVSIAILIYAVCILILCHNAADYNDAWDDPPPEDRGAKRK